MHTPRLLLSLFLACFLAPVARADEEFVYVSCRGERRIEAYAIGSDGKLKPLAQTPLPGAPAPLALSPDRKRIYAATQRRENKEKIVEIVTLRRGPTGKLVIEAAAKISQRPAYLRVSPKGEFLLAAHYGGGFTTVFSVLKGAATGTPTDRAHTRATAHCAEFDPSGRFVFIPHTKPNRIYQYRFNPKRGELVPLTPPSVAGPEAERRSQPRHLRFHPTLALAYTSNERGGGISSWSLSKEGTLTLVQTLSTLPKDFRGESAAAEIRITPNGRFAYVSNRDKTKSQDGADTIACFAIDALGKLSAIGHAPAPRYPRSFNLAGEGRLLYAAGQRDSRLVSYRIGDDGRLSELERRSVGKTPSWVLVTR